MNDAGDPERARVLQPGEGVAFHARGSTLTFKARGTDTKEAFSLMERELPPAGRAPTPHRHPTTQECFYVLSGMVEFLLGTDTVQAGPGSFIFVPPGLRHTFANRSQERASVLILHSPALDDYFADLDRLSAASRWDAEAELEIMRRHGLEPQP